MLTSKSRVWRISERAKTRETFTIRCVYEPLAKRLAKLLVAVHGYLKH